MWYNWDNIGIINIGIILGSYWDHIGIYWYNDNCVMDQSYTIMGYFNTNIICDNNGIVQLWPNEQLFLA